MQFQEQPVKQNKNSKSKHENMMQCLNYNVLLWGVFGLFFPYKSHTSWFFVIFSKHILNYLLYNRNFELQRSHLSQNYKLIMPHFPNLKMSVGFKFKIAYRNLPLLLQEIRFCVLRVIYQQLFVLQEDLRELLKLSLQEK